MTEQEILVEEEYAESEIDLEVESSEADIDLEVEPGEAEIDLEEETATWNLDYNSLFNKPHINGEEVIHDKSIEEYGVNTMSNLEIKKMIERVFGGT